MYRLYSMSEINHLSLEYYLLSFVKIAEKLLNYPLTHTILNLILAV